MSSLRPALTATLREAVRSLYGARLRTLLGLVGIMIGIASVITMISTGEIAKSQSRKQFEALGTDILSIRKSDEIRPQPGGGTRSSGSRTRLRWHTRLPPSRLRCLESQRRARPRI